MHFSWKLLAVLIGLQKLPEGFNGFREQAAREHTTAARTLIVMLLLIPLGPMFGSMDGFYESEYPRFIGALMLFATGGILYLLFQDIAAQSRLRRHPGPCARSRARARYRDARAGSDGRGSRHESRECSRGER